MAHTSQDSQRRTQAWRALTAVLLLSLTVPAIAEGEGNVYVANRASAELSVFDVAASGQLAQLPGYPVASGGTAPYAVAITPNGRHLYVANAGAGTGISAFQVAADGSVSLLPGSPVAAGSFPVALAVSPDGTRLYAANQDSDDITAFSVAADGSLSELAGSPFAAGDRPSAVAISPDGKHLYAANEADDDVTAFAIAADGSLSPLAGSPVSVGSSPRAVAIGPGGKHLYVSNWFGASISAFSVGADGTLAAIPGSPFAVGGIANGLALSPDGSRLYVTRWFDDVVGGFTVAADGALVPVAGVAAPAGDSPASPAVAPAGSRLYVGNAASENVSAYSVVGDGSLAALGGSPFPTLGDDPAGNRSLAMSPNQGPTAALSVSPGAGRSASFDASASTDPDGTVTGYAWDFGDGSTVVGTAPTVNHAYASDGDYSARVTVTDDEGCSTTLVFTGQTASCNGSAAATSTVAIRVGSSGPPDPPADPGGVLGVNFTAKRKQRQRRTGKPKISVVVKAGAAEPIRLIAKGRIVVKGRRTARGKRPKPRSFRLKTVSRQVAGNRRTTLRLKPLRTKQALSIRTALRKRSKVVARVQLTFIDRAGNRARRNVAVTLLGPRPSRR